MDCPLQKYKPCRLIHSSLVLLSSVFRLSYSASLWSSRLLTMVSCSWTVEPSRPQYSSGISSSSTLPFSNWKNNTQMQICSSFTCKGYLLMLGAWIKLLKLTSNRPLALRGHVTNASLKQWVIILLMPKIDRAHKSCLTPEIWEETHLRKIFYGTLILQQS